jgi:hypothetical protein
MAHPGLPAGDMHLLTVQVNKDSKRNALCNIIYIHHYSRQQQITGFTWANTHPDEVLLPHFGTSSCTQAFKCLQCQPATHNHQQEIFTHATWL